MNKIICGIALSVLSASAVAQQPTAEQQLNACQGQLFAARSSSEAIQSDFGNKVAQITANVNEQVTKLQERIKELEGKLKEKK